jgi:hypothetical protein
MLSAVKHLARGASPAPRAAARARPYYSYVQTAKWVGLTERNIRKWAKRFLERGQAGLFEHPRPGRIPLFLPEVALYVVKLACEGPDQQGCFFIREKHRQWDGAQ